MVYLLLSMSSGQGTSYCVTIMSHVRHKMFSASAMFSVHISVVDVLTSACIAWSQGQGGYVQRGREVLGTPFRTYSNLFL